MGYYNLLTCCNLMLSNGIHHVIFSTMAPSLIYPHGVGWPHGRVGSIPSSPYIFVLHVMVVAMEVAGVMARHPLYVFYFLFL